jgi:hypothetical protein
VIEQKDLFEDDKISEPRADTSQTEVNALDEMFAASRNFRNSARYLEMLKFIGRFRKYSPFNCLLLFTQNPAVTYVATARTWANKFNREPKFDARPLVILAPMSPVLFVYDLKDTEGKPVPEEMLRPFRTSGTLKHGVWDLTLKNCQTHGIAVRETMLRHQHAGSAVRLNDALRRQYDALNLEPWVKYLVLINKEYSVEDKYSSLAHELGHIFCGHVGVDEEAWWEDRTGARHDEQEIEAESVAYLVCRRIGLEVNSDRYLANYQTGHITEMPPFSLNAILTVTSYIEDIGRKGFKRRKSRYKSERSTS